MIFDLDEFVSKTVFFAVYVFFANVFLLYLFFWKWYFFGNGDVEEFVS